MRLYITGIGGLVGSTLAEIATEKGWLVHGCDSDYRGKWFGSSIEWRLHELESQGIHVTRKDFRLCVSDVEGADAIVHCASQPSHDFSRSHPIEDSLINYIGTLELLEATRLLSPKATFVFISTNKVYGDRVNTHAWSEAEMEHGIPETYPVDASLHTPFGVSKLAADVMVQEYRRAFGLRTVTLRCGCLTGSGGTAVELQGFLGYLVARAVAGEPYTIYGHSGEQVRDNLDARDLARAILAYISHPQAGVYNMGGGPENALSVNEAIEYLRQRHRCQFDVKYGPTRMGDHVRWVTDTRKFQKDYPSWSRISVWSTIDDMVKAERARRKREKAA